MGNFLYTIAVILLLIWAVGYIGYSQNGLIHILLVVAVVAVILRLIPWKRNN
jgi:predicted ferric reductase